MKRFILAKIYLVVILIIYSSYIFAQTYNIGHISTDFYDNARNRNIATEIYYPSDTNGDNVPISMGNFPIIVFGHGFLMKWDSYHNYKNFQCRRGIYCIFRQQKWALPQIFNFLQMIQVYCFKNANGVSDQ